ncbi:hypothetical protein [Rhodothermus marinus]|nr:hypothetical protein [Rhodothermus marinus]
MVVALVREVARPDLIFLGTLGLLLLTGCSRRRKRSRAFRTRPC